MEFTADPNKIYHSNKYGDFRILRELEPYRTYDENGVIKNTERMVEVQFIYTGTIKSFKLRAALNGSIRDPFYPIISNIGFLGNASSSENKTEYIIWSNMIREYARNKDKYNLSLDTKWECFELFLQDLPYIEGYHDMINNKNEHYIICRKQYNDSLYKKYSIETCILLTKNDSKRNKFIEKKQKCMNMFYGVMQIHKDTYTVKILDRHTNTYKFFGTFDDELVAAAVADIANITHGDPKTLNNVGIKVTQELLLKHKVCKHKMIDMVNYIDNYEPLDVRNSTNITTRNISVGDIISSANYGDFEIIEILEPKRTYASDDSGKVTNTERMCRIRFLTSGYETDVMVRNIINGNIRDPYYPSIYGVACLGNTTSVIPNSNRTVKHLFAHWKCMIDRCYNIKNISYKTYGGAGIKVCDRWLCFENFEKDAVLIPGYQDMINNPDEKYVLDKDILQQGKPSHMKIYSPTTCMWVTNYVNTIQAILDNKDKCKNTHFCVYEEDGKYRVRVRNVYNGKVIDLGLYQNEIIASIVANYGNRTFGNMDLYNYGIPNLQLSKCMKYRCLPNGKEMVDMIKIIK